MFTSGKLSYESAKLKARLGQRLSPEKIQSLLKCQNIEESVHHLQGTPYEVFYESYVKTGYLGMGELAVKKREIDILMRIRMGLRGEVRKFVVAMLSLYEIENLKGVLAVWLNAAILERKPLRISVYLKERILHEIPYDRILSARDFAAVVDALKDTPYGQCLSPHIDNSRAHKTLFYFGAALDAYYYSHLKMAINSLNGPNRFLASRFFGTQVDFENLRAQLRYKSQAVDLQTAQEHFLTGGKLSIDQISEAIQNTQNLREFLQKTYPLSYPTLDAETAVIREVELCEVREMDRLGRFMLTSNPLSIAPIIAYFYCMKEEVQFVISLLESAHYGLSEEEREATICLSLRR